MPSKLGRYEVVRELGKGAMGVVYLGRDPVIGRMVALKTIRVVGEDEDEQKEFGERFLREAQAAGILSHPNIVTVHDVGEDPETNVSFIAMEFVEGKNLKQLVAEKAVFSYERVAEIVGQVAEALDYAHRKGIVHRDVKPANVIITSEGAVKITDFGIAKIEKSSLTSEGQFLGTPNYMSPEQVTGDTVDGRSDLFSLGVVLYELLTRKKPFAGENLTSISYKIVHETFTPPETFDAEIPPEFTPILGRALAKNPADRYQRGREFALALYEFKARQEERDMLRDLGQMVAAAENLGGVAAIDLPPATLVTPLPGNPVADRSASPEPVMTPARPAPSSNVEVGAMRGEPVAVTPAGGPVVDYSAPDWTIESGGVEGAPGAGAPGGVKAARDAAEASDAHVTRAVPVDPLDGVTERLDLSKHAPFLVPAPKPPEPPVPPPAAGVSEKTERIATGMSIPRPVAPPAVPAAVPPPPVAPHRVPAPPPAPAIPTGAPAVTRPVPPRPAALAATVAAPPPAGPTIPSKDAGEKAEPAAGALPASLRREVNPRFVVLIVGSTLLVALLVVGILLGRQRAIRPQVPVNDAVVKETKERKRLLSEGEQLSAQGKYEEALARFRELARRSPESAPARAAVARAEQQLQEQRSQSQEQERRSQELASHLAAAREAESLPDDARVVSEAAAALALDPANADAKALKDAAEARLATKTAAEKKKEAALAAARKKARPTPVPIAPVASTAHSAPPTPVATPGTMTMRISFASPVPRGLLMVGVGNSIVFRKDFDFGKNSSGGVIDGSVSVPSGPRTVKVWLIATDRSLKPYSFSELVLPGGESKTLAIALDGSQKLSFALR